MADKGEPRFSLVEKTLNYEIMTLKMNMAKFELEEEQIRDRVDQLNRNMTATEEALADKENSLKALRAQHGSGNKS